MKKLILALVVLLTTAVSANAMSYQQAREQALFLTDKMAYELNLTDEQYEAAYEINLDYLLGVTDYNSLYGTYWTQRNMDLSYILLDWQYQAYCAANYFYRPLYWDGGYWHFGIYARYPRRDYFYFGRPHFYTVYRGGHSWRMNGGRSWYRERVWGGPDHRRFGMRDGYNRGDFGRSRSFGNRSYGRRDYDNRRYDYNERRMDVDRSRMDNGGRSIFNRTNAERGEMQQNGNRSFGGRSDMQQSPTRSFGNRSDMQTPNSPRSFGGRSGMQQGPTRSFGGRGESSRPESSTRTTVRQGGFGSMRNNFNGSSNAPSRMFSPRSGSAGQSAPNHSSGNFGGGGHFGHR